MPWHLALAALITFRSGNSIATELCQPLDAYSPTRRLSSARGACALTGVRDSSLEDCVARPVGGIAPIG